MLSPVQFDAIFFAVDKAFLLWCNSRIIKMSGNSGTKRYMTVSGLLLQQQQQLGCRFKRYLHENVHNVIITSTRISVTLMRRF